MKTYSISGAQGSHLHTPTTVLGLRSPAWPCRPRATYFAALGLDLLGAASAAAELEGGEGGRVEV